MSSTTTTPASAPSPTEDNFFTPGSSPPLILAFLAIGIFSAAMIAVFGWRRVQFGRAWTAAQQQAAADAALGGRDLSLGDPPKLWDYWTEVKSLETSAFIEQQQPAPWRDMLPLSAAVVLSEEHAAAAKPGSTTPRPPSSSSSSTGRGYRYDVVHEHLARFLRNFRHPRPSRPRRPAVVVVPPRPDSYDHDVKTSTTTAPSVAASVSDPDVLRVAVAILMPSPNRRLSHRQSRSEGQVQDTLDYSIGLYYYPWNGVEG